MLPVLQIVKTMQILPLFNFVEPKIRQAMRTDEKELLIIQFNLF